MELDLNGPDALKVGDKGYNGDTEGAYVVTYATSVGIDLRHEVTGETINKMSHRESYEQDWRWFRDGESSDTVRVAQAVSALIEDGVSEATTSTFLPGAEMDEDTTEFIDGVGAELIHLDSAEAFEIRMRDGRVFQVTVAEVTGRQQTTIL